MYLTDTLTKSKREFVPLTQGRITMYHCGPTVYWNQHIGNIRSAVIGDFIRRSFIAFGYDVFYLRNYTDVGHLSGDNAGDADSGEDRMTKGALREGITPDEIADKYIAAFEHDISLMGILPPTRAVRATHHISEMIRMVSILLEKGIAYETPLAIYLDVSKVPNYNKLSKQDISKLLSGSGSGDISDSAKRNSGDFSVWFFKAGVHAQALQTWESPFTSPLVENGRGFPGWHLECSAMIHEILGTTIDIHIGGIEHIPIHHTNEIAQSECCFDEPLANYWLHNEHLLVDSKKMSKSEGTSYLVSDIIERGFDPLALRYFFLQAHYRSQQNFTWEGLTGAQTALDRIRKDVAAISHNEGVVIESFYTDFLGALADDVNTPKALAIFHQLLSSGFSAGDIYATACRMDEFLGIGIHNYTQPAAIEITDDIQTLLDARAHARTTKNWSESDRIRDELLSRGIKIVDGPEGQSVEPIA
jgi:cysteinyl-tRNA synthetase